MRQQLDMSSDLEKTLWQDACLAADVFALMIKDGSFQSAGIMVKAHAGPVRDVWMAYLRSLLPADLKVHAVPTSISVERLLGGLDLGLTLTSGKASEMRGVLSSAHEGVVFLPNPSLADPAIISLIASSMDSCCVRIEREGLSKVSPACFGMICFDESEDGEEEVSSALTDRLTLHIDLRPVSVRTAKAPADLHMVPSETARMPEGLTAQLCALPLAFGLTSMRPTFQMAALARALCRLDSMEEVEEAHIQAAIRIGLAHRAQQLPAPQEEQSEPQNQPEEQPEEQKSEQESPPPSDAQKDPAHDANMPEDMAMETLEAALPPGLLTHLKLSKAGLRKRASAGRQGARVASAKRGRPLASRKGDLVAGKRLDFISTLRAAAPHQKARNLQPRGAAMVQVRTSDFHIRRYQERSETVTIFVVDASGSTAINRLREAKGAIELLLGESYARRDYVALISFRGREAQILLPPTRALVRAKRSLASLPGGGGTPLACGLQAAVQMAQEERKRGRAPSLVIMTDGSANVDAQGAGGRKQAAADAEKVANMVSYAGIPALLVDIGRRPDARARHLASVMDATYIAMPFAKSKDLSAALNAAL